MMVLMVAAKQALFKVLYLYQLIKSSYQPYEVGKVIIPVL